MVLAMAGTIAYVRRAGISPAGQALAGSSFALSAPLLWRVYCGGLTVLCTVAWLPWCVLGLEWFMERPGRRRLVLACIPVGMAGTAGHPQYFLILLLGMGLYGSSFVFSRAFQRRHRFVKKLAPGLVVFLGVSMAAVQLLPSAVVSKEMLRSTDAAMERWGESSFPPEGVLTLWMPYVFGNLKTSPYWGRWYLWECNAYVGLVTLILAMAAVSVKDPRRRGLLFLCVGGAFVAFGKYNPLLRIVMESLPPLRMFRGAAKCLVLPAFGVSCLAGVGLHRVLGENPEPCKRSAIFALIPGLLGLLFFCFFSTSLAERTVADLSMMFERYDPSRLSRQGLDAALWTARRSSLHSFFFASLVGMAALPFPEKLWSWLGSSARGGWLLLLCAADLLLFARPAVQTFDESLSHWPKILLERPKNESSHYRIAAPGWVLPNQPMAHSLRTPEGYDVNLLVHSGRYLALATFRPEYSPEYSVQLAGGNPLVDALGVRYVLTPLDTPIHLPELGRSGESSLHLNEGALPRARMVYDWLVCEEVTQESRALQGLNVRSAVLVDRPLPFPSHASAGQSTIGEVTWMVDDPDLQVLRVRTEKNGILFVSDAFSSGWRVFVNGEPRELLRANMGFRGVSLSPGTHEVVFRYRCPGFLAGAFLTGMAIFVCLVLIL